MLHAMKETKGRDEDTELEEGGAFPAKERMSL
jgi:hypothetical protein